MLEMLAVEGGGWLHAGQGHRLAPFTAATNRSNCRYHEDALRLTISEGIKGSRNGLILLLLFFNSVLYQRLERGRPSSH